MEFVFLNVFSYIFRSQMGCVVLDDYLYVLGGTNRHNEVLQVRYTLRGSEPQSTQSGNDSFLAYRLSWWKNQPWLVRMGDACPSPCTISTISYKVVVYAPAESADTLPIFLLYPYMYSVFRTSYWIILKLRRIGTCSLQYNYWLFY